MQFGRVIGNVISTKNNANLAGIPLLIVQQLNENLNPVAKTIVCTDTVSSKAGDVVLTCSSSSARLTSKTKNVCTDNSIVAIVEIISSSKNDKYKQD